MPPEPVLAAPKPLMMLLLPASCGGPGGPSLTAIPATLGLLPRASWLAVDFHTSDRSGASSHSRAADICSSGNQCGLSSHDRDSSNAAFLTAAFSPLSKPLLPPPPPTGPPPVEALLLTVPLNAAPVAGAAGAAGSVACALAAACAEAPLKPAAAALCGPEEDDDA